MATSKGGFGIGKIFAIGKRTDKDKRKKEQYNYNGSDEDEEDTVEYVDPTETCSTEPPQIQIPIYPPPRPANLTVNVCPEHKLSPRLDHRQHANERKGGAISNKMKDDYQDPYDSKLLSSSPSPNRRKPSDNYADPYDATFTLTKELPNLPSSSYYEQPVLPPSFVKGICSVNGDEDEDDDYDQPYENKPRPYQGNNYAEPFDSKRCTKAQSITVKPFNRTEDYSDPWDAKSPADQSLPSSSYEEEYYDPYDQGKSSVFEKISTLKLSAEQNNNDHDDTDEYDLPYEDQKRLGIIQHGKKSTAASGPLDYDEPWEWKNKSKISATNAQFQAPKHGATSSKQPVPKQSPSGDYDAPWEWKQKEIDKRFSVDGQPNATKTNTVQIKHVSDIENQPSARQNINPIPKPARTIHEPTPKLLPKPADSDSSTFYQVDPTIPLENQGWFHGIITRLDAEMLLQPMPDCSYLIRNSESSKDYSLSLRNKGECMHLKISYREGSYILGVNSKPYDTIPEMIHYYSMNKLNIRGAEHVKLICPVLQEATYFTVEPGT